MPRIEIADDGVTFDARRHEVVRRRDDGVLDMMMAHLQAQKMVVNGTFKRAIPVARNCCPLRDPSTDTEVRIEGCVVVAESQGKYPR